MKEGARTKKWTIKNRKVGKVSSRAQGRHLGDLNTKGRLNVTKNGGACKSLNIPTISNQISATGAESAFGKWSRGRSDYKRESTEVADQSMSKEGKGKTQI